MTASTQTASNGRVDLGEQVLGAIRNLVDVERCAGFAVPMAYADTYTVPTTAIDEANDILRLCRYPGGAYLSKMRITATDMDTNATPALVFDIVVTDANDTVKAVLINDTTIGQGAGSKVLDDAEVGEFVGGYWLALKTVTAAATPAAGTLKVYHEFSIGVMTSTGGANPKLTDVAV